MPRRLRSGYDHHRLGTCGPSNEWPSQVSVMPPSIPRLAAFASASDVLDIPFAPNAVFSQFLGSASLEFFPSLFFLRLLDFFLISFSFLFIFPFLLFMFFFFSFIFSS